MKQRKLTKKPINSLAYLVVTPCKNEEKNLPNLINSIESQTVKPVLWIIVDDGSTDKTPSIIREAKLKHPWIQSIQFDSEKRDRGLHLANIIKTGFDFGISYCLKERINYMYLSNVDSDIILENQYFEKILNELEYDSSIGIASGNLHHYESGELVSEGINKSEPPGACIVIRRNCFEQCNGIYISYAWESVLNAKAKLKNWKTKVYDNITVIEVRDTNSAEGYWKGFVYKGECAYYLDFNIIHVLIKTILYLFKKPYFIGVAYLYGYFSNSILKKPQIDNEEIKYYFRCTRKREIKLNYQQKIINTLKASRNK